MAKRLSLDGRIAEAFADGDKDGQLTAISLVHMQGWATKKEVHTAKIGSKTFSMKEWADLFLGKAQAFAQDLPGMQTFCLLFFYADRNEAQAEHPFTIQGETGELGPGLGTEKADATGLAAQAMRHMEQVMRMTNARQESQDRVYQGMLADLYAQNRALTTECLDAVVVLKKVMLEDMTQKHTQEMQRLEFERRTQERQMWMKLGAPLVNQILGREVFPQSAVDTQIIEGVAANLNPEDAMKVIDLFPAEVQGLIANRIGKYHAQQKQTEAIVKREMASHAIQVNPEDNAAGD